MQTEKHTLKRGYSELCRSLRLVAAAAWLWPATADAQQSWNPTASVNANTAAGTDTISQSATGSYNTALGFVALFNNTTGSYNAATGAQALKFNTTGGYNTATGANALYYNTEGSANTASGYNALLSNDAGSRNTASGYRALQANTNGGLNTANGYDALYSNTLGGNNTASGDDALYANTTGSNNTADGVNALYKNTTGKQSTAIGMRALYSVTTGNGNVAVGYNALSAIAGGAGGNIALGANAGYLTTSGSNDIYIGSYGVSGSEANVTRIGRTQTKVFVTGIAGVPLSGATVVVKSNGQLGVVASSARYKENIKPLTGASEKLAQLRPVSFSYKTEPGSTHYGLIAEEVEKVMPELVVRDEQNRPESVQYLELIPLLLQERHEMQTELTRQRALIEQQAEALAELRRILDTRLAALDDKEVALSGSNN
jgi:hypothetical protein